MEDGVIVGVKPKRTIRKATVLEYESLKFTHNLPLPAPLPVWNSGPDLRQAMQ